MSFLLSMIKLGLQNLWLHRLRSLLTALGIIFGVAAVIIMVAIGEGSKLRALANIERLGAKNIIIRSQKPPESQQMTGGQQRGGAMRYGLTFTDLAVLTDNFAMAEAVVPLKEVGNQILKDNRRKTSQTFGTTPQLQKVANLHLARGRYLTEEDIEQETMVGVIGAEVAKEMFPFDDPLENTLRIDGKAIRVVGVLAPVGLSGGAGAALVGRDLNLDVHIPITTARLLFGDRVVRRTSGNFQASDIQVSEIYLTAPTREDVILYAELARRLIDSRKPGMPDVGIIVPYELLESARRDALTWQVVLSFIAGISLLVGGIGIMNIMLASVTERTREIGIRRALGATRKHIIWQFLVETGVLSLIGGIAGVGLGVGTSLLLGWGAPRIASWLKVNFELATQVTFGSIILAFSVAALTGLVFGLYPALQAAKKDPIVALRHD